jgi:hypothetical protein
LVGSGGTGTGGVIGSGGSGTGGVVGSGGSGTAGTPVGGTGGSMGGGAGGTGGTTAKDASADVTQDSPGFDGNQTVIYSGCGYGGDIERAVVAKFDARAGVCVTLVLESPHAAPDASFGMTISQNWGVAALKLWASSTNDCATRNPPSGAVGASSASGSVTVNRSAGTIDIDAVFDFPASDAGPRQSVELKAQGVDFMHNC